MMSDEEIAKRIVHHLNAVASQVNPNPPDLGDSMSEEPRLFGCDGDEILYDDLAVVVENYIDDTNAEDREDFEIIEWTVAPAIKHLPDADTLIEHTMFHLEDLYFEELHQAIEKAGKDPDVRAALQAALDLWASKVTGFRVADEDIAHHKVTWQNGHPLVNGSRLFPNDTEAP